jgi:hypothetical protein
MSATISNLLVVRAERLGVYIKVLDQEEPDIDFGLFVLCCAETEPSHLGKRVTRRGHCDRAQLL